MKFPLCCWQTQSSAERARGAHETPGAAGLASATVSMGDASGNVVLAISKGIDRASGQARSRAFKARI